MTDKLLITLEDIQEYRNLSDNMDVDRIATYIRESQFIDLRGFLGRELYALVQSTYDESNNLFTDPNIQKLFFGEVSNGVEFYGIKAALVYYSYARILENIQLNVTRAGVRKFNAEESEEVEQSQINTKVINARSMALAFIEDAKTYLDAKSTEYPTWKIESIKTTGLNFFKV